MSKSEFTWGEVGGRPSLGEASREAHLISCLTIQKILFGAPHNGLTRRHPLFLPLQDVVQVALHRGPLLPNHFLLLLQLLGQIVNLNRTTRSRAEVQENQQGMGGNITNS